MLHLTVTRRFYRIFGLVLLNPILKIPCNCMVNMMTLICHYVCLETPCRKIFDTRVFSGKKGHKGYKKMTFQENRYKAKMQNIWYIKKIMLCG